MGNESPFHLSPNLYFNFQIKMLKCKVSSEMGLLNTLQMMLAAPLEIAPDTDMILTWTRTKLRESSVIKAELRATENFLEHYIQLTLLSTLTWIYYDHKDEAYTRLSAEIIGDNKKLITLSAIISALSLLRGQGGNSIAQNSLG